MSKEYLGYDPISGIHQYHHYDHLTDITTIESVQNVEPIIERNKELAKTDHQQRGIKGGFWHAASVPNIIIEKWLREDGVDFFNRDHWGAVKRKLNDPEWAYLRTGRGKL